MAESPRARSQGEADSAPQAKLILKSGQVTLREVPIESEPFIIGRALESDLELIDSLVSRRHAKIVRQEGQLRLIDLGSSNGTYVNDERITEHALRPGDIVRIGSTRMEFQGPTAAQRPKRDTAVTIAAPTGLEEEDEATDSSTAMVKKVADLRPDFSATLMDLDLEEGGVSDLVQQIKSEAAPGAPAEPSKDSLHFFILYQLSKSLNSASSLDDVLERALEMILQVLKAERGCLMLLDQETGELSPKVVRTAAGATGEDERITISHTIARRVIDDRVAMLTKDAMEDPRLAMGQSIVRLQIRSALCVPLWEGDDVSGLIYMDNTGATNTFTEDDRDLLTAVANQIAVAMKQEELKEEIKRESLIRANLARYHSPGVVDMIVGQEGEAGLDVKETEVSVLFSDIEGFSTLSEDLEPGEIAKLLNGYFELMTGVIFDHQGTVNKFIGDGILALFGAPLPQENHALAAVQTALRMNEKLEEYRESLPEEMRFNMRVGVNTGPVVVGNIGSSQRMEYTALGHTVNTAARLEKIAPPNGCVVGPRTAELVADHLDLDNLGTASLKGIGKKVEVFEVLGERGDGTQPGLDSRRDETMPAMDETHSDES